MSNAVFPTLPGLAWSVKRTPRFSTLVQQAASGREVRAALWAYPIYEWALTYDLLRDDASNELKTLFGFFLQRQGSFDSFLYDDPNDNAAASQQIGSGNGTTTQFPCIRTYGGFVEPVAYLNGTPAVYVNGVQKTQGSDFTILNNTTVALTVAPPAGQPVTATFSYYFRVRFKEDMGEFENFAAKLWQMKTLTLVGVKP